MSTVYTVVPPRRVESVGGVPGCPAEKGCIVCSGVHARDVLALEGDGDGLCLLLSRTWP